MSHRTYPKTTAATLGGPARPNGRQVFEPALKATAFVLLLLCASRLAAQTLLPSPQVLPAPLPPADAKAAQEQPSGVLLLRNGHVLQGQITQTADEYRISLPYGQMQVKRSEVEAAGETLKDVYLAMRRQMPVAGSTERMRLAHWCIRNGLWEEADQELREVAAVEPGNSILAALRRKLETEREQTTHGQSEAIKGTPVVSPDDLDRLVRSLPPGAVESFTQRVQPVLVNNCMSAACHGTASSSELKLLKTPSNTPPSRRVTQRNLHSVMQWVDHGNPSASRILAESVRAHGGARTAAFPDTHSAQYRRLVEWVYQVANRVDDPHANVAGSRPSLGRPPHPAAPIPAAADPAGAIPTGFDFPIPNAVPNPGAAAPTSASRIPTTEFPPQAQPAPAPSHTLSVPSASQAPSEKGAQDPFDPAVFNRRYHNPENSAPAKALPQDRNPALLRSREIEATRGRTGATR